MAKAKVTATLKKRKMGRVAPGTIPRADPVTRAVKP